MATSDEVRDDNVARIAVLGCGNWGRHLIRNLAGMGCLTGVCDVDARALAAALPAMRQGFSTSDAGELLARADVDGVVIATPGATHAALVRQALEAGKDVLVEGPLADTVEEAEAIRSLADRLGRVLMVGSVLHHHPAVQKLLELVQSGTLGKLRYIYSNRLSFGNSFPADCALQAAASQDIALLLRLAGRAPESVVCTGGSYLKPCLSDVTVTSMDFGEDLRGHVFSSWLHPFKEHRVVVAGTKRMAVFDDVSFDKLVLYDQGVDERNGGQVLRRGQSAVVACEGEEPLLKLCKHFVACICARSAPEVGAEDAVDVQRILKACLESLANREAPVRLAVSAGV